MAIGAGRCDCVCQAPLGCCSILERLPYLTKGGRVSDVVRPKFMVLESDRELVCLLENLFDASGHSYHLRYVARAGMAWTITGPSSESTTPIS